MYIADIDKYMKEKGIDGVSIDKEGVWSLAYADDMVIVAKNRDTLMGMMEAFRKFIKEKGFELNTEKTKVLIFNKKRKEKKKIWKWEGKEIEEVKIFKYLGFTFNRKGDYTNHIKELSKKGRIAVNMVWGLGERICRDDFSRRWMLFRYLMQSVMSYGAEIWEWEERKGLEKVMMDYIRWIFNLDFCTPRYLMSKELSIEKLKVRWGINAIMFEERIKNLKEKSWVKRC